MKNLPKVITTRIEAHSRMALKVKDNYFTFEYIETREIKEELSEEEVALERTKLWDECNYQIDNQAEEAYNMIMKPDDKRHK